LPLQPPDAVHAVALLVFQVSVTADPAATVLGAAVNCISGASPVTVTSAVCVADPPGPVQTSANPVVADSAPVGADPAVGMVPFQPSEPEQDVAFAAVQVSVALSPTTTVVGEADSVTVGDGGGSEAPCDVPTAEAAPSLVLIPQAARFISSRLPSSHRVMEKRLCLQRRSLPLHPFTHCGKATFPRVCQFLPSDRY
jgi:hypothetical protein